MTPIFLNAKDAACLLGISKAAFLRHVEANALPGPAQGLDRLGHKLWDREQLVRIARGDTVHGLEDVEL